MYIQFRLYITQVKDFTFFFAISYSDYRFVCALETNSAIFSTMLSDSYNNEIWYEL